MQRKQYNTKYSPEFKISIIVALSDFFDVSADYLLGRKE